MLSIFPLFLSLGLLAPLLLRITLGIILIHWAVGKIKSRTTPFTVALGVLEVLIGIGLLVGFLVQLAALIASVIFLIHLIKKAQTKSLFTAGVNYYFILFMISLSLLLLGAGAFAFDLPL